MPPEKAEKRTVNVSSECKKQAYQEKAKFGHTVEEAFDREAKERTVVAIEHIPTTTESSHIQP